MARDKQEAQENIVSSINEETLNLSYADRAELYGALITYLEVEQSIAEVEAEDEALNEDGDESDFDSDDRHCNG